MVGPARHDLARPGTAALPRWDLDRSVSVVVPTYRPPISIDRCVRSLCDQSLDPIRFEVILVINGPPAADLSPYRELRTGYPDTAIRVIGTPVASVGHARNVGINAAAMGWITFVDDDDTVAPDFLAGLIARARPGFVPLTSMDDVLPDGSSSGADARTALIRSLGGTVVDPTRCPAALGFNAAKLVPADWARGVRYDETLQSGEDVCFFAELYARRNFAFDVVPHDDRVVYHRQLSPDSISRRDLTEDFAVRERLDVIVRLAQVLEWADIGKQATISGLLASQVAFIRRYLLGHPERRSAVELAIHGRGIASFPWRSLGAAGADTLVVSMCSPPFADPSAVTVAKRIAERGELVDLICNDMSSVRTVDDSLHAIAGPFIGVRKQLAAPTTFGDWTGIRTFAELGWAWVADAVRTRGPYGSLYSRAMWPASHFLGAVIKTRMPATRWIAEFSDPLARTVTGAERPGPLSADDLVQELLDRARNIASIELPTPRTVYELTELLPYAAADEIWFTNMRQRDYMLSYCGSRELAELVREKSEIRPHPIPPPELYRRSPVPAPEAAGRIRLAYFGTFYANRSIRDVISGLGDLPGRIRSKLHLDVYSGPSTELTSMIGDMGLGDVVCVRDQVTYLEFLNLTTQFDCLIVNDAATATTHPQNPYLPSKWSDYRGSGAPIWAIVETGSTLADVSTEFRSVLGDGEGASGVLRELAGSASSGDVVQAYDPESVGG